MRNGFAVTVLTEFILFGWGIVIASLICFMTSWMRFPVLAPISLSLFMQAVLWFVIGPSQIYVPILAALSCCSLLIALVAYVSYGPTINRFLSILSVYFVVISAANILLQYQFGAAAFTYTTSAMTISAFSILLMQLYSFFIR